MPGKFRTAIPIQIAEIGPTNPDAGVMATIPATAPVAAPKADGLPRYIHSAAIQANAAAAVDVLVAVNVLVARAPAPNALPALNPNHPNQSKDAPVRVMGKLCAGIGSLPCPNRFLNIMAHANPAMPALI